MSAFQVFPIHCGPIGTASYIIANGHRALVVDPADARVIIDALEQRDLRCEAILLTHGHFDHIMGVEGVRTQYDCPVLIGEKDALMLKDAMLNCSMGCFGYPVQVSPAEKTVKEGDRLEYAGLTFTVMETPGHSEGGVCYVFDGCVFAGDTLFYLGIGRTDLFGGDMKKLRASIRRLYTLDGATVVYPGHSEPTTIAFEAENNPYVRSGNDLS